MSRETPSQRLLVRLKAMGVPVVEGQTIQRTYVGRWQRAEGAWTWQSGPSGDAHVMVGSIYSVTELLRQPRLCAILSRHAPEWSIWSAERMDPGPLHATPDTYLVEAER